MEKTEGEILEAMVKVDEKTAAVHAAELEVKKFADEVAALAKQIEEHADAQKAQLAELDKAIIDAESVIDEDQRDRYRRTVKQRGADALAAVDGGRLLRLLRHAHPPGHERTHQRPQPPVLHDLRPDALPHRRRPRQHTTGRS